MGTDRACPRAEVSGLPAVVTQIGSSAETGGAG